MAAVAVAQRWWWTAAAALGQTGDEPDCGGEHHTAGAEHQQFGRVVEERYIDQPAPDGLTAPRSRPRSAGGHMASCHDQHAQPAAEEQQTHPETQRTQEARLLAIEEEELLATHHVRE